MPFGCITSAVREKIVALGKRGLTVIVDSCDRIGRYTDVIVKPNEVEAARAFRGEIAETAFADLARALARRTGRPAVVTAGERGCYVAEGGAVTIKKLKTTGTASRSELASALKGYSLLRRKVNADAKSV